MSDAGLFSALTQSATLAGIGLIALSAVIYALSRYVQAYIHPLVVTTLALALLLPLLSVTPVEFQQATAIINWCLGPAVVALAVPMYQQWQVVRKQGLPILVTILVGGVVAPMLAWLCVWLLDAPLFLQLTLLAKSITTPLAIDAVNSMGGVPELAAVFVIVTGLIGAIAADSLFSWLKVTDRKAQGLALGTIAHAIGTAKAVEDDKVKGAFSSLALCVNGIVTVVILPLFF